MSFERRTNKKLAIWNALKIALAIALAVFVFSRTDLNELRALTRRLSIPWVLTGILAFCAVTWFSARRYWILIGRQIEFSELLGIVILQSALTNFVASGAGAASYVGVLRGEHQLRVSKGVMSLLLAKVGDLLTICLALTLSMWMVWAQIVPLHRFVLTLQAGIAGGLLAFLLATALREQFITLISHLLHRLHCSYTALFDRALMTPFALADQDSGRPYSAVALWIAYSCLVLASMIAWTYCFVRGFALPIGLWPVVLVVSLTQLMAIVPIQVFGGLGVYDVTSMYLYSLFGLNRSEIAAMLVWLRVVLYLLNLLTLVYLPLAAYRKHEADTQSFGQGCTRITHDHPAERSGAED